MHYFPCDAPWDTPWRVTVPGAHHELVHGDAMATRTNVEPSEARPFLVSDTRSNLYFKLIVHLYIGEELEKEASNLAGKKCQKRTA